MRELLDRLEEAVVNPDAVEVLDKHSDKILKGMKGWNTPFASLFDFTEIKGQDPFVRLAVLPKKTVVKYARQGRFVFESSGLMEYKFDNYKPGIPVGGYNAKITVSPSRDGLVASGEMKADVLKGGKMRFKQPLDVRWNQVKSSGMAFNMVRNVMMDIGMELKKKISLAFDPYSMQRG